MGDSRQTHSPPEVPVPRRDSEPAGGLSAALSDGFRKACRILQQEYGLPRHGNLNDPVDELVFAILSTRTRDSVYRATFDALKSRFPSWDSVTADDLPDLETILRPAGLGRLKARQIVAIIDRLRGEFGAATLGPLADLSDERAEAFLTALPGVSKKVAKCVLMYSLGRRVLPVDAHVHRLASRFGLPAKKRPDTSQDWIEGAVPPDLRYTFHVDAVAHGRAVCRAGVPLCDRCCIAHLCRYVMKSGERHA